MSYFDGFVLAVPEANRAAFIDHANQADAFFLDHGAVRVVESWGDEVPRGTLTDFYGAVQATEDEAVVFSWVEWPDRATRDKGMPAFMADERLSAIPDMPFDGKRMIFGGFEAIADEGRSGDTGYADGYVLAVPEAKKDAYVALARKAAPIFREHGATRVVESWGVDVPDGQLTDFRRAVKAEAGEAVVFSFCEWPDKAARDAGWAKLMEDERMKPDEDQPFDGKRMFWGGFRPIVTIGAPVAEV